MTVSSAALDRDQVVMLQLDPNRPGWYRGQLAFGKRGMYVAGIRLDEGMDRQEVKIKREFEVRSSNLEILQPQMDRGKLMTLAKLSSGGEYFGIDQAYKLPAKIPDRHETRVSRGTPKPLWDAGWMLLVFVILLGVEWTLRKRWQLL